MTEQENICDSCKEVILSSDLIWIDSEDFEPLKEDDFNSTKHQECLEIFYYSALCESCYKELCCGNLNK